MQMGKGRSGAAAARALAVAAFGAAFVAPGVWADDGRPAGSEVAEVRVSGVGTVERAPDMAILSLTVAREAASAREAVSAANEAMAAVRARLREAGIADRDLQTQGFSIQPRIEYPHEGSEPRRPRAPRIVGYEASNALSVRVRELDRVGALLDQTITLGVNRGGDIRFVNDDPAEALAQARAAAMRDARDRARTLVGALDMRLGRLLSVTESDGGSRPVPMAATRMMEMAADGSGSVPVAAGENSYTVRVEARWAIEP